MTEPETDAEFDSADATPAFDDLMFACTQLCELLEVENDALENHDADTVAALGDRKIALTRLYATYTRALSTEPDTARLFTPEQREDLLAIGHQLEALVERNALLLRAAIDATRMAVDILAQAVRASQDPGIVYGRGGTLLGPEDRAASYSLNNFL